MSFTNKVVIVTGSSSGIGAATAIAFAAEGANVVIVGRNRNKLQTTETQCEQVGSKPLTIIADVSNNDDVKRIKDETLKHFGKIDVLVNNAGMYAGAGILDPNAMEVHEKVMKTNLYFAVYLTHLVAPHLVETKGNIINVSSIAALGVVAENSFSYMTSKAGLDHFTKAVALELASKGVRVNSVNPGLVKTDFMESMGLTFEQQDTLFQLLASKLPLQKFAEPEEIANLILFLASDKARSITGSAFVSDNGALMIGPVKI